MSTWGLLDEKEEQDLHKRRLLNVEEKPFKRITKRLNQINALIKTASYAPPSFPASGDEDKTNTDTPTPRKDVYVRELEQLREDLALDFAAFDNSIARLQFLADANKRERAGYEEKRAAILDECQAVREKNADLRLRLEEARGTLAQRKKFDELADKITNSNGRLRPRAEQRAALQKLEEECRELERESETYNATWRERRDQFSRIMEEGMLLRSQIRDEKEEVDRRDGMNEDGEEDGEASRDGATPRPTQSGNATPQVESGVRMNGGRSREGSPADSLRPRADLLGLQSQGSQAPTRSATPQLPFSKDEIEEGEDVEMEDDGKKHDSETPQITIDGPAATNGAADRMEVDDN
ncbi:uncharacterized protein DNG_00585 [Cephalotrichum gorgonifer]|uniref:Tho complex subunit 7 n=1 Tax=Cephalotrichum gorgonifer TaxID=2041049 RepID=A0AAE8MQ78_9PEZI|nr:uncharacterized protein DNG_00585 [Cephalotrichum gorgonifer]